jgi:hypothetical protein
VRVVRIMTKKVWANRLLSVRLDCIVVVIFMVWYGITNLCSGENIYCCSVKAENVHVNEVLSWKILHVRDVIHCRIHIVLLCCFPALSGVYWCLLFSV